MPFNCVQQVIERASHPQLTKLRMLARGWHLFYFIHTQPLPSVTADKIISTERYSRVWIFAHSDTISSAMF